MTARALRQLGNGLPMLFALALALWMIALTTDVGLLDVGDFRRSVDGTLRYPVGHPDYAGWTPWMPRWVIEPSFDWALRLKVLNTADLQFAGLAWLQDLLFHEYDVRWAGVLQKLLLGACLFWMCHSLSRGLSRWLSLPMFVVALSGVLSWHHAGFFHSFYQEQALFLAFVLGLAAHFSEWRHRGALIVVATMWAANAKPQYFYLPALVLLGYWLYARMAGLSRSRSLVAALGLAQMLALVPLAQYTSREVNYYHSLYFGSLMLSDHAFVARQPECVGTDVWGWRYKLAQDEVEPIGRRDCLGAVGALSLADVLKPYWQTPSLAPRILTVALDRHSTVNYFHVRRDVHIQVRAADASEAPTNAALQALTRIREAVLSRHLLLWLVLGAVLPWIARRDPRTLPFQIAISWLSCFAASQLVVAVLGEGFRDLSKHWVAAQFSADLMFVLAVLWGISTLARVLAGKRRLARPEQPPRSDAEAQLS
jgi:hypothetical protein